VAEVLDAPGVGVFLFDDRDNLLRPAAITDEMCEYYGGETVFGPGKPDSITWQVFVTGDSLLFDDPGNRTRTSSTRTPTPEAASSSPSANTASWSRPLRPSERSPTARAR